MSDYCHDEAERRGKYEERLKSPDFWFREEAAQPAGEDRGDSGQGFERRESSGSLSPRQGVGD